MRNQNQISDNRRKTRRSENRFNYELFESRNLLAGVQIHQVNVPLPDGANLIYNGDFELTSTDALSYFNSAGVPGWNASSTRPQSKGNPVQLMPFNRLGNVLDLDSSSQLHDQIFQDVLTKPGTRYLLSFDFRTDPAMNEGAQDLSYETAEFEVWWNGTLVTVVHPNETWKTMTIEVYGGAEDFSRLTFAEVLHGRSSGGDGIGALIDNVRLVHAVDSPIDNGGFEELGNAVAGPGYTYPTNSIPNWNSIGTDRSARVLKIEPVRDALKGSALQHYALNLNGNHQFRDAVFQDLETEVGTTYYVTFLVKGTGGDQLRVRWDNAWALTVTPGSDWESVGLLVSATHARTQLMFLEGSQENQDMWIDNVRVYRVDPGIMVSQSEIQPSPDYRWYVSDVDEQSSIKKRESRR